MQGKKSDGDASKKEDVSPLETEVTQAGVLSTQLDPFVLVGAERVQAWRAEPVLSGTFGAAEPSPTAAVFVDRDWLVYDRPAYARRWR